MDIDDKFLEIEIRLANARIAQSQAGGELFAEIDRAGDGVENPRITSLNKSLRDMQSTTEEIEKEKREFLVSLTNDPRIVSPRRPVSVGAAGGDAHNNGVGRMREETPEARERSGLVEKSDLGRYITTLVGGGNLDGAEAELRSATGMGSNEIPLDLFEPGRFETRADTATNIASADYGRHVAMISPYVFSRSVAPRLDSLNGRDLYS